MRITVSAQASFFENGNYPIFEKLLAAAAIGLMSIGTTKKFIDVQVNPVLVAVGGIGQFVSCPQASYSKRFFESPRGRSTVTIEIDHVNEQMEGDNEQLLCHAGVALIYDCFPRENHVNCLAKFHGGAIGSTGECDIVFTVGATKKAREAVQAFADNDISPTEMVERVEEALFPDISE